MSTPITVSGEGKILSLCQINAKAYQEQGLVEPIDGADWDHSEPTYVYDDNDNEILSDSLTVYLDSVHYIAFEEPALGWGKYNAIIRIIEPQSNRPEYYLADIANAASGGF